MTDTIQLKEILAAVDSNAKDLWDDLDEAQQKTIKDHYFILNRYASNVSKQPRSIQEHYVLTVNEYFNKNWNALQEHPKLLWMLLCMCGYDETSIFYHEWIGLKKAPKTNSKKVNFLASVYPNTKMDEIQLLANMLTDKELKEVALDHGFSSADIKKLLK